MDIKKLLKGITVVIDDQVNESHSTINKIKHTLEKNFIPVLAFEDLPSVDIIPSLSGASMVILDLNFFNSIKSKKKLEEPDSQPVMAPAALKKEKESNVLKFVKKFQETVFAPLFIITSTPLEEVKNLLSENEIYHPDRPNRIFLKNKIDFKSGEDLFSTIENWFKESPSSYTLKEWEKLIEAGQNSMFLELYSYTPNWVKVVWQTLKKDSLEYKEEFGEFLTRNLSNRIFGKYSFCEEILEKEIGSPSLEGIKEIFESERYICYKEKPNQAYTGDLFKEPKGKYFLNIRAQCDLARAGENSEYNPLLFGLEGKALRDKDVLTKDVCVTKDKRLVFDEGDSILLEDICKFCNHPETNELENLNKKFKNIRERKVFYREGTFLCRGDKTVVGCIDKGKILEFSLKLQCRKFKSIQSERIGRILPPYITQIQQKCAAYLVREGTLPIPEEAIGKGVEGFPASDQ